MRTKIKKLAKLLCVLVVVFNLSTMAFAPITSLAHGSEGVGVDEVPDVVDFDRHFTDEEVAERGFVNIDGVRYELSPRTPWTPEDVGEIINIPAWLGIAMIALNVVFLFVYLWFLMQLKSKKKVKLPKILKQKWLGKFFKVKFGDYATAELAAVIIGVALILGEMASYWDIWQHVLGLREALLSPPHNAYYTASGVIIAVLVYSLIAYYLEAGRKGKKFKDTEMFPGFGLFLIFLIVFIIGGMADNYWHTVLFVEHRLSITHFVAEFGALFLPISLFVFAWSRVRKGKSRMEKFWKGYGFIMLAWSVAFMTIFRIGTFYPIRNWAAISAEWHNYANVMYEPAALFLNSLHFSVMFVLLFLIYRKLWPAVVAVVLMGLGLMIFAMAAKAVLVFIVASFVTMGVFKIWKVKSVWGSMMMGAVFAFTFYLTYYFVIAKIFGVELPLPMDDFITQVWEPPLGAAFYAGGMGFLGGFLAHIIAEYLIQVQKKLK